MHERPDAARRVAEPGPEAQSRQLLNAYEVRNSLGSHAPPLSPRHPRPHSCEGTGPSTALIDGKLDDILLDLLYQETVAGMDNESKARLEQIRARTPRYLFRMASRNRKSAFGGLRVDILLCSHSGISNNTPTDNDQIRVSGGRKGLNKPTAITPLACKTGRGKRSVYDLRSEEFTEMAVAHLTGGKRPVSEVSSWAASLLFTYTFCRTLDDSSDTEQKREALLDHVHISIIDTKALGDSYPAFFVPALDFLAPGRMGRYVHEYLVHGVVQGPAHKAVPLRTFVSQPMEYSAYDDFDSLALCPLPIGRKAVSEARTVGEAYGSTFALPMTLARLCLDKRDDHLFRRGVPVEQLGAVLLGTMGLRIPQDWDTDETIMTNIVYTKDFTDVVQFIRLMRMLVKYCQRK
ncbi:hypothetical protein LTR37_005042 [Vermiconidia calcicola]|uniref:Uncharacterized protein n=1 Tax=Vermiconidia calcicola TaxID=1690605 RepID=A0ACC3NKH5_9PEZI|nr:hypothetical protein LTR37_005042 [Vermiconidia calcicola]